MIQILASCKLGKFFLFDHFIYAGAFGFGLLRAFLACDHIMAMTHDTLLKDRERYDAVSTQFFQGLVSFFLTSFFFFWSLGTTVSISLGNDRSELLLLLFS